MSMTWIIFTLAAGEWVGIIAFVVIAIIGLISNVLKEAKKKQEGLGRGSMGLPPRENSGTSTQARLEELAQRRRQQLQELAQRRRANLEAPPSTEPTNLTIAQRTERMRAKAEYEKRAAMLRNRAAQPQPQSQAASPTRPRPQQRQQPVRPAPPQRRPDVRPAPVEPLSVPIALGEGVTVIDEGPVGVHEERVHRHVKDVAAPTPAKPSQVTNLLKGASWRDAFILKEILDPPVGLRADRL